MATSIMITLSLPLNDDRVVDRCITAASPLPCVPLRADVLFAEVMFPLCRLLLSTQIWYLPDGMRAFQDPTEVEWIEDKNWALRLDDGWDLKLVSCMMGRPEARGGPGGS